MDDHGPDVPTDAVGPSGAAAPTDAALTVPGVMAVDHVGLAVPDLDAAIRFHTEVLGLVLVHREVNQRQGVAEAMLAAPGAPADAAQVQLLAPVDATSAVARFLERSGPGLQQLAYRVADLDVACAALRTRGVRLLYSGAETGTRGSRINFVHPKDAGGVLVELVEVADPPRDVAVGHVAHDPAGARVDGG